MTLFCVLIANFEKMFRCCSGVSIIDFEQASISWVCFYKDGWPEKTAISFSS